MKLSKFFTSVNATVNYKLHSRSTVDTPQPHCFAFQYDRVLARPELFLWLILGLDGCTSTLDHSKVHSIPQLVLISESGGGRASVREVIGFIKAGDIREPERTFWIDRHS